MAGSTPKDKAETLHRAHEKAGTASPLNPGPGGKPPSEPKARAMKQALMRTGRERGYTGERLDKFVYGILRKRFNWSPRRER